jgi:hypothetical protein
MNINSNLSRWIADFQIDDLSDWEHQAAQMSSLYKNAFFTIANTMGTSVHDNIRLRTPPHEWVEVPWTFGPDPSMQGSFIVDANQNDLGIHNFDEDVKNSVWVSRMDIPRSPPITTNSLPWKIGCVLGMPKWPGRKIRRGFHGLSSSP